MPSAFTYIAPELFWLFARPLVQIPVVLEVVAASLVDRLSECIDKRLFVLRVQYGSKQGEQCHLSDNWKELLQGSERTSCGRGPFVGQKCSSCGFDMILMLEKVKDLLVVCFSSVAGNMMVEAAGRAMSSWKTPDVKACTFLSFTSTPGPFFLTRSSRSVCKRARRASKSTYSVSIASSPSGAFTNYELRQPGEASSRTPQTIWKASFARQGG